MSTVQAFKPWWIAAAIAGLLGWWLVPMPDAPPNLVKPRQDSWRLPVLPRRVDQTSTAALVSGAGYWGAPTATAAPGAAPIEDPRWRLAAVYGVGSERGALVEFSAAGKPAQRLRVGEALPSGHRIVAIGERDICVLIGRKSFRLGVERSGS